VDAYGHASLDRNPLHFDPEVAALAGLPRPPVHGMLIVGCFEAYVADWRPGADIVKLSAKFVRPVLLDDSIEIAGKVVRAAEGQPAVLRLTVKAKGTGDIACLAEIFLRP
jgi:acyl dehydratase